MSLSFPFRRAAADSLIGARRWLGFRLDCFGSLLTFVVAIFGVGTRTSISPSQTGEFQRALAISPFD